MNLEELTLSELSAGLNDKQFTSVEVVEACLRQTEKTNTQVNAFVTLNEKALEAAKKSDSDRAQGQSLGPLAGLPIGIKDMLCTQGLRTTAASKMLESFIPPYSATVVSRLEKAGAIVFGKCNQDEFAMGSSNEVSAAGVCRNPWNLEYVPGGSSGGSAACVAARMVPASIGTDTGGSIRQPANFCGVVGMKPTYGRVSRYGIVAFASSLDQAGPLARSVKDCALVAQTISGHDAHDSTTTRKEVPDWAGQLSTDVRGMRVGLPKEYFTDSLDKDVRQVTELIKSQLKEKGAELVEVSLPLTSLAVPIYYLITSSEASSNLARYDGVRYGYRSDFQAQPASSLEEFYSRSRGEGFGSEVKRRIMLGTYALSSGYYDAYYSKACQVRRKLRDSFVEVFSQCDVILSPVTTTPAFRIGERIDDPLTMYMNDIFTTSANLAGIPGISVPAGMSSGGLPIGVQLMASHFEEQKMLNVAAAIEQLSDMKGRQPDVLR